MLNIEALATKRVSETRKLELADTDKVAEKAGEGVGPPDTEAPRGLVEPE